MGTEENKAIMRRVTAEIWNGGNLDNADELLHPEFFNHLAAGAPDFGTGPAGFKKLVAFFRGAFPDLHMTGEQQIAEGDTVVTRWSARGTHKGHQLGVPPTGKEVTMTGLTMVRLEDGKVREAWGGFDALGLLQQLDVLPTSLT
jgi:steroid delta-isomerase-like uncharacterized protein